MPFTANRKRPIQVKFFVDENELAIINQRMNDFGTNNLSTYLRTMAMRGFSQMPMAKKIPNRKNAKNRDRSITAFAKISTNGA